MEIYKDHARSRAYVSSVRLPRVFFLRWSSRFRAADAQKKTPCGWPYGILTGFLSRADEKG